MAARLCIQRVTCGQVTPTQDDRKGRALADNSRLGNKVKRRRTMENNNPKGGRLNSWVSLGFKLGVMISLALVIVGLILTAIAGAKDNQPVGPLSDLPQELLELNPMAIITLGILVLLVTPIMQVVVALVTFSIDRDKLFLGICITLLCVLALSLALALI